MRYEIVVNGAPRQVDVAPDMPLLWVLRDILGLTGTKFGCGIAQCGACTVQLDGQAVRSCQFPMEQYAGQKVATVEGLSPDRSHLLQQAWIADCRRWARSKRDSTVRQGGCQQGHIVEPVQHGRMGTIHPAIARHRTASKDGP